MTTQVLQIDLARALSDVSGLRGYDRARVVLRYGTRVVGQVFVGIENGVLPAAAVMSAVNASRETSDRLSEVVLEEGLLSRESRPGPSWSVVVCTRDRPEMLRRCVESLLQAADGTGEIIVVDNAGATDATKQICERYPVRYLREDVPGLNRARALGARMATGEVVIYTDDDTVADPGWIRALVAEFDGARVGAVTGLTLPLELETEAQELFEHYGGFSRGFRRRAFDLNEISPAGAGAVGSGASMAFRRDLVVSLGLFDVELDLGTSPRTGGDTYALYRVLTAGYRTVYTSDALNWHQHRRELDELNRTMQGYGTGLYAFLTKVLVEEGEVPALRVGLSWFRRHHLRELARALARRPNHLSLAMVIAEIKGTLVGPIAYLASRKAERARIVGNVREDRQGAA